MNQWILKAGGEASRLLRSLRDKAQQWWYFLDHPQVPPAIKAIVCDSQVRPSLIPLSKT
ncbi:hypothetical protein GS682_05600 [Nostoc sp. B(2019)]|nr:hypothetical protein [Nostoc sp. B(2019)]